MAVLIVDDDPSICEVTSLMLEHGGFNKVQTASSAIEAFRILGVDPQGDATFTPDVIVMDIMMPEVDGIEACARIKLDKRYNDTPILMATTLSNIENLKKAFLAGASDYMNKPIRDEELIARVRASHRLKKELERRKAREAELSKLNQNLSQHNAVSELSSIDPLTGLQGETALLNHLEFLLNRTPIQGVLVTIAIDAWQAYCQRNEAEKIKDAIQQVAISLGNQPSPLHNQIYYIGEGRFMILYPNAAGQIKEQIALFLHAITNLKIKHAFSPVGAHLSASASIISLDKATKNKAALLIQAIELAQAAEKQGGNRIL